MKIIIEYINVVFFIFCRLIFYNYYHLLFIIISKLFSTGAPNQNTNTKENLVKIIYFYENFYFF